MQRVQGFASATMMIAAILFPGLACLPAANAQANQHIAAGQSAFTFINRLVIDPPQAVVYGYLTSIQGYSGPMFSGTPGEATAYFTWTLDAEGADVMQNGDTQVAVLPSGHTFRLYYDAAPNRSWSDPAGFAGGQLIAEFKTGVGTQTGSGPDALVTQSYLLTTTSEISIGGEPFSLRRLLPHGFTSYALGSNIPLSNALPNPHPLVFTAAGTAVALGSPDR